MSLNCPAPKMTGVLTTILWLKINFNQLVVERKVNAFISIGEDVGSYRQNAYLEDSMNSFQPDFFFKRITFL